MILLDTHIWVWWINSSPKLTPKHLAIIQHYLAAGLAVSVISCWEVAKLATLGRLNLFLPVDQWLRLGLTRPGIRLVDLTPKIAVEANYLPGTFHRDPADQILVATARELNLPLLTADAKILAYPHVHTLP